MDSRNSWSWKEGFRFALCWKFQTKEELFGGRIEMFGSWVIEPFYKMLNFVSIHLRKPLTVVLFTIFSALIVGLAFYNIPAFTFLGKIVPVKAIRFFVFIYTEWLFFGMGCRAFGRFHNQSLVELWKRGKLVPLFPGERKGAS